MLNCIANGIEVSNVPRHGGYALTFGLDKGDLKKSSAWEGLLMFIEYLRLPEMAFHDC